MSSADGKQPPHIIMILCDQLRADAVRFMHNPLVRTPNLDRLASRGTVFENMFAQVPVCMGSRACILTGRYARANRMASGTPLLDPRETTLAEHLQRIGYHTGTFGKLHLTPQQYTAETLKSDRPIHDATPFLQDAGLPPMSDDPCKQNYGFQECVGFEDILWGEYVDWLDTRNPALAAKIRTEGQGSVMQGDLREAPLVDVGGTCIPASDHPSMFIAEHAADSFTRQHAEGPCFQHVSFVDPHHPFDPPQEILDHYDPDAIPLPAFDNTGDLQFPQRLANEIAPYADVTPQKTRQTIAHYYAMMEMVDRAVGHLLDAVERAGEMENTIFAFIADHGEFLGSYGLWRKGSCHYDCLLRVPSFIAWPGHTPEEQRVTQLTESVDLLPTLLGMAGLGLPAGVQGTDWSAGVLGDAPIGKPRIWCELYEAKWGPFQRCWTVRTDNAKLNYYPQDRIAHLFDLDNDPQERVNCFDDPDYRSLREEMMMTMLDTLHETTDPLPYLTTQF